ncbi:ubiquitin thioesterase trabid isoform X2 [Spodoptera frugiperda]|uniref:ubiquitinyl hydrolase 1 n=1 Tax=Spodoptera frugiperda TaxID=7108 RepID=A0A9R0EXI9_SPOFR|nr:ubiquitin thioesterase trabid isoform X2 [Spodoptera frugiperda]
MSEEVQDDGSRNSASLDESDASGAECATLDASTNISQTTISQMTASSVTATEGAKWCCHVCTYENFPLSRKCTMCRSPKSVVNEDIFRLQDGASALPTQEICGAEAVTERLKPLRISSPQGASASSVAKWPCPTCTYDNWPRSLKCAMCGSSNPAAPPAPPAPPAAPPAPPAHPPPAYTPHPAHPALGINDICNSQSASIHELDAGARRSKRRNNTDWIWLQACLGVVEGDARCVESYLSGGGDPARALTHAEVALLNRASAFDAGHTLVHLAIRFQRQEILSTLLSRISGGGPGLKRSPSYIAPDLASAIRRHIASTVRYKKGGFPVRYIGEFSTFYLPAEISELPAAIQEQLFSELLDREAQATLEGARPPLLNWRGSRLYALWNRSAGDCLPDALCQAAWGVADRHNTLRAALHDALQQRALYARWAAWERAQAARLQYAPSEAQLRAEWARLAAAAARPGQALHQLHVWALAHVLRRPILVYGVDVVNSFRGEALGYARFRGLYLPLLCEAEGCSKSPLSLAYTRGHFSALVPLAPRVLDERAAALPLTDPDGKLLPVHFLSADEMCDPESVVRRWVCAGEWRGVLAARQALPPRPLLQAQLLEEWLNHYRRLAQQTRGPAPPRLQAPPDFSSDADADADTDDE